MPPDLLAFLLAAAVRFSGYPAIAIEELPIILRLPAAELAAHSCPEREGSCARVAAAFEPGEYVIYLRDTLDLEDPADNSFLVHELVHVLQWKRDGDTAFAACERALESEREAYRAQNAYLKQQGRLARFGHALTFATCAANQTTIFGTDPALPVPAE